MDTHPLAHPPTLVHTRSNTRTAAHALIHMYRRIHAHGCMQTHTHAHPHSHYLQVRKTANEFYLAAAGLPDPELLPHPTDRACGLASFGFAIINVMDNVNLELQRLGISNRFTVQAARPVVSSRQSVVSSQ